MTARPGEPTPAEQCEHGETAWHEVVVRPNWEHRICPGPVTAPGVSPRSNEEIERDLRIASDEQAPVPDRNLACTRLLYDIPALLVEREDREKRIEELTEVARRVYAAEADVILAQAERDALAAERDNFERLATERYHEARELRAKVAAVESDEALEAARLAVEQMLASAARSYSTRFDADEVARAAVRAALAAASPGDEETNHAG